MSSDERWLVKDSKGRIYGPFTSDRIQHLIARSVFVGDEKIALYPEGDFQPISRIPKFYDRLLEILAQEYRPIPEKERIQELTKSSGQKSDEQTKTKPLPQNRAVREDPRKHLKKVTPAKADVPAVENKQPVNQEPDVIELRSNEAQSSGSRAKNVLIGGSLMALGILVVFLLLSPNPEQTKKAPVKGFVALLAPQKKRQPLPEPELKNKFAKALQAFNRDTFDGYYRAQDMLIEVLESGYQNIEANALLCLTHRELWPFSNQDSKDLLVTSKMAQISSSRDPVGVSGATCRVVQQLLGGQFDGAASLTDSILNENPQAAVFYEFKAQIQSTKGDHINSAAYLEKAEVLMPQWLKPKVSRAESLIKLDRYQEAAELLRQVIKLNPSHGAAHVLLAEIELYQFKRLREGVELSVSARSMDRLSKGIESRSWVVTAVGLERGQRNTEALEAAKTAFQLDPTNLSAKEMMKRLGGADSLKDFASADRELVALGEEYLKKGNYFAAQAEFKSAFELNPKNGRAAYLAGKSLWELNQSLDAIDWMKKAIVADPNLISAYTSLADYHAQRYDFKAAYESLQKIQKLSPQNYQVLGGFAQVELRRFNFKGAVEMSKKALSIYDTDVSTLLLLAQAQKGLNDYTAAFETMARAITLDSNFKEGQALYAEILGVQQGADLAIKYLQDLINTYPQETIYRLAMGRVLLRDERLPAAIEQLEQATAVNERSKDAFLLLGEAHKRRGEVRPSLKAYLSAAALDPSDAYPVFLAGELYFSQSNFRQARQQFEQVLKVNNMFPKAHYMLGKTHLAMGEFDRAFQLATAEKRANPLLSSGYELAGDVLMAKRDFQKATQEFQKANQISPTVSNTVSLARAHRLMDNLTVAQSLINRAMKLEDGNPEIYKEQGALFEAQSARTEAVIAYRKYLDLSPNAVDRAVIDARIRSLGGN